MHIEGHREPKIFTTSPRFMSPAKIISNSQQPPQAIYLSTLSLAGVLYASRRCAYTHHAAKSSVSVMARARCPQHLHDLILSPAYIERRRICCSEMRIMMLRRAGWDNHVRVGIEIARPCRRRLRQPTRAAIDVVAFSCYQLQRIGDRWL